MPVIEKYYEDLEEKKEAYARHMEYFLTNDITSAIPVGVAAAMEERYATEGDIDPDSINAVKTALMGPLAGLGDSLLNGTARPILLSLIHIWYGCAFAGTRNDSAESRFQTFALTYGCDFVTDNGDGTFTSGFGTPEFKNAMTSFVNMAANQGVTPPGLIETGYSEAYTMIAADQACMFFSASNVLGGIYNANPEMRGKMGSFPMPTAEGVDPVTSFSSVGMTVSSTCKNPEVAADFLKYMTSVENLSRIHISLVGTLYPEVTGSIGLVP